MLSDVLRAEPTGLPSWLRAAVVAWCIFWFAAYYEYFGWQFVLWFCCMANMYVMVGCITNKALWFSLAAIAALGVQALYTLDFAALCILGESPTGATAYMLDENRPLWLRGLSLFHVWMPALMVFAIHKLGYDRRALWIQTPLALCILPLCYFAFDPALQTNDPIFPMMGGVPFDRDFNINWVHAFYDRPEPKIGTRRLWAMLIGYPLLIHWPTHWVLSRTSRDIVVA